MPSIEPSPRPWRVEENCLGWKTCIVDANGNDVASCWGGEGINSAEPAQADAALIVDAANERDRLRDIVRRTVETLERVYKHADMTDALREVVVEAQREARDAIEEDAP